MKGIKKQKLKGMTLVEVLVAMLIFSFIATISSGIFVSMYKTYYNSKIVQQNMEDANYAMNLMSKILRTSTIVSPAGKQTNATSITVFDNSQSRCYIFEFTNSSQFQVKESIVVADKNSCPASNSSDYSTNFLSTGKIKGLFRQSWQSNDTRADYRVGLVTMRMSIGDAQDDLVYIQTTMSLRDYSEVMN